MSNTAKSQSQGLTSGELEVLEDAEDVRVAEAVLSAIDRGERQVRSVSRLREAVGLPPRRRSQR